jgi:dienelactone hydrolase
VVPITDGFLALLADGIRYRVARYTRQGDRLVRRWLDGEHVSNLFGLAATVDGRSVIYAHATASSPTRWHRARLDMARLRDPRPIADCNEHLAKKRFARREVIRWKGGNAEEVEGLLFYPHGWKQGQRAPLVVQIHGGPAAADHDAWDENWSNAVNLVCQRGAFVLRPNYHGSAGYGREWLDSITGGKYCELEVDDIERGIDALVARGLVDARRIGLTGWSNGAILTNVLVTRRHYRAAVVGAGSIEYISDWASCEFGEAFDSFYLGKSPLEDLSLYLRKSPFYRLDRVKTPTLILFGANDRIVHPQQGWAHYRALQQLGKTPVRFVLFPDEQHSLNKLSHQRRKLEEELTWLDRHLFAAEKPAEHVVKKDTPLQWLLKRQSARRVSANYGVLVGGVLAPETVRHGKLAIGRFEVTRAQYSRFDPGYCVEPGKENYPANGITFEQARGYCAWLSKKTGKRYRLPTEAEAEDLYEKPEEGDNTLDAWAGYAVNPDDAVELRQSLRGVAGQAPLLKEVGAGRGRGKEELVYDLEGNVAEWVTGKEGKGKLRGGSADLPADTRSKGVEATGEYRGFRVTLDE